MKDLVLDIHRDGSARMRRGAADSFLNNVYLSLMVDKGSYFQDPEFGSRLYLLKRSKSTQRTAGLARDYCLEAVAWMVESGRAKGFEVEVGIEKLRNCDRLNIRVLATKANGQKVGFSTFREIV